MNIIKKNHLRSSSSDLLCGTVVLFLTVGNVLTHAASFEVSGHLEFRSYKQGTLIVTGIRDFQVSVRDNAYCIRLNPAKGDKGFEYWENASDGTNGYSFVRFQHSGKSTSINDSTLVISSEREPSNFDGEQLGSIWLAYCASSLFTNGRATFLRSFTPLSDLRTLNFYKTIRFRAEGELDETPPHLLRRFADFYDIDESGEAWVTQLPKEYISGQSNSTLRLLSWTNFSGLHVPDKFEFTFLTPLTNATQPRYVLLEHRATLTNCVAGTSRTNFVPAMSTATRVIDHRFGESPQLAPVYMSTNRVLLQSQEEVEAKVAQEEVAARRHLEAREAAKKLKIPRPSPGL